MKNADDLNRITEAIIQAAIKVHRVLGPGLLESAYRECLVYELRRGGFRVGVEQELPLVYEELHLPRAYRIDLIVADRVVVEVKSIERFENVHRAQMLTYLRLSGCHVGLILNFNKETLVSGLKRVVNDFADSEATMAQSSVAPPGSVTPGSV